MKTSAKTARNAASMRLSAAACPNPTPTELPKAYWYTSSNTVSVEFAGPPDVKRNGSRKTCAVAMICSISVISSTPRSCGSVTCQILRHSPAPSTEAASYRSRIHDQQRCEVDDHRRPGVRPRRLDDECRHRGAGRLQPTVRAEADPAEDRVEEPDAARLVEHVLPQHHADDGRDDNGEIGEGAVQPSEAARLADQHAPATSGIG